MIGVIADQASLAAQGAAVAGELALGDTTGPQAFNAITSIEHAGDERRSRLVVILGQSLSTPVDREDLNRLSRSVDDVVDNLRDYVRESQLYRLADQRSHAEMLALIGTGMDQMRDAIIAVGVAPNTVSTLAVGVRRQSGAVRRCYQDALAALLTGTGTVTIQMVQHRELLRRIDIIALRMAQAADALTDGVLKRSH